MPYDVAFSLLSEDEEYARKIQDSLPAETSSFLYSSRQRELVLKRDGLNAFPEVFREAQLCVVLYRERWGETRWTRLEERTLGDRFMDEGSKFLMLLSLDTSAGIPAWFPRTDIWVDFVAEGPERTAEFICDRLDADDSHQVRNTARSFGRRAIPVARYQNQVQKIIERFEAVRPMICDACTSSVEYRPMLRVTLPSQGGYPACTEQLCPSCARDRGIKVAVPRGMDTDVVYSKSNPSYRDHVQRLLSYPVLPSLSGNEELKARGVTNVGATIAGTWIELIVSQADQASQKLGFELHDLEQMDLKSDRELIDYFRERIVASLENAV